MDEILEAITCGKCSKILNSPIILPCSHTICKEHTENVEFIICLECDAEHSIPEEGIEFPSDRRLTAIINARIQDIDYGIEHNEAKEAYEEIESTIEDFRHILSHPHEYTQDIISDLQNKVSIIGESLVLHINQEKERLINDLETYQERCKDYRISEPNKKKINELDRQLKENQNELIGWKLELNKFDELNEILTKIFIILYSKLGQK